MLSIEAYAGEHLSEDRMGKRDRLYEVPKRSLTAVAKGSLTPSLEISMAFCLGRYGKNLRELAQ